MRQRLLLILLCVAVESAIASGTVPASYVSWLPAGAVVNSVGAAPSGRVVLAGTVVPPGGTYVDAFVATVAADGSLVYLTKLAGTFDDRAQAVAVDSAGNAYACGSTASSDFPVTRGAWQTTFQPSQTNRGTGFVAKISPKGEIVYATYADNAACQAIAVNAAGEAFFTGYAGAAFTPTPGAASFDTTMPKFVARLSAAGDRPIFALTGPGGNSIAVDARNVYTAGAGVGLGDVPITPGAFQQSVGYSACGGGAQLQIPCVHQYVCKMDLTGTKLSFCTYVSGTSGEGIPRLAPDANGDIWLTGTTTSTDYLVTGDAEQPKNVSTLPPTPLNPPGYPGVYRVFATTGYISKLSGDGSRLLYSSYLGGTQHDQPGGLALDDTGLYISVLADSPDFPGLPSNPQWCLPSRLHGMPLLVKLDPATHALTSTTVVEGAPNGTPPLLAVDAQHAATLAAGRYFGRVGQVSTALFDPIACITDSGDFVQAAPVAPGQLLTIWGTGIGPQTPAAYDPNGSSLPLALGGYSVQVNGSPVPLLYASSSQINFVAPYDTGDDATFTVNVVGPAAGISQRSLVATPVNPGLFTLGNTDYPACGSQGLDHSTYAAVFNEDGSLNSCENPAVQRSLVRVVLNGAGLLAPHIDEVTFLNTVERIEPVTGMPVGLWNVYVRLGAFAPGYTYITLRVNGINAREQSVAVWVQ